MMPRIPFALCLGLGLGACAAPEVTDLTHFAPSPVRVQVPGQDAVDRTQGCWTQDASLGTWIETPCADQLPAGFVTSLQRALSARGYYASGITGEVTPALRAAIRAYQVPLGLNSEILSLGTAERLGLVAVSTTLHTGQATEAPIPLPDNDTDPRARLEVY